MWACTARTLRQCWFGTSWTFRRGLRLGVLGRIPPKCVGLLVGLRRGLRLGLLGRIPPRPEELLVGLRLGILGCVSPFSGLCRSGLPLSRGVWLSSWLSLASLLVPPQSTTSSRTGRSGRSCGVAASALFSSPPLSFGSGWFGEVVLLEEGSLRPIGSAVCPFSVGGLLPPFVAWPFAFFRTLLACFRSIGILCGNLMTYTLASSVTLGRYLSVIFTSLSAARPKARLFCNLPR